MKKLLVVSLFMLATLVWAAAQQPMPQGSGGQATSPSAQVPDASQSQSPSQSAGQQPGSAAGAQTGDQAGSPAAAQSGAQGQMASTPVTEGCLGGSNPNYTITDQAGKTYKLNIPAGADASVLSQHIGEPVAVMGAVNGGSSISVTKIGRGTTKCPGSSGGAQVPPKQ